MVEGFFRAQRGGSRGQIDDLALIKKNPDRDSWSQ